MGLASFYVGANVGRLEQHIVTKARQNFARRRCFWAKFLHVTMARGCLSASKASRRKRVPLPTLCEVQYGRNKWQKGVYCSSYHLHNFRSLSAPPSDMLQTTFYRPSQTNEPVTIGCRTPRVLNVSSFVLKYNTTCGFIMI